MAERVPSKQLTMNWEVPSAPIEEPLKLPERPKQSTSPAAADVLLEAVVLPWNFTKTFPPPLQSAMDSGTFLKDVPLAKQVAERHEYFALKCLLLIKRIEGVRRSKASAHIERREWLDTVELNLMKRLELKLREYENLFGLEAGEAFLEALNAQLRKIEIFANPDPNTGEIRYDKSAK
jgi:hypothetical protein